MTQMNEIVNGERSPSRKFVINGMHIKEIRKKTGLTQAKFCRNCSYPYAAARQMGMREIFSQTY
jgi:DNA-binding transcriptional regulator YiaG